MAGRTLRFLGAFLQSQEARRGFPQPFHKSHLARSPGRLLLVQIYETRISEVAFIKTVDPVTEGSLVGHSQCQVMDVPIAF